MRLTAYALEGFCRKIRYRFGNSISPHRFRHSTATSLANESGSNLKALQQYLGHTSMQTTLEYVHPDLAQMRDLVERLPAPRTKGYDSKAIACKPRASRVQAACKPRASRVQAACKPRASRVQAACKPRAGRETRGR